MDISSKKKRQFHDLLEKKEIRPELVDRACVQSIIIYPRKRPTEGSGNEKMIEVKFALAKFAETPQVEK
jgi:hypothetical protein